MKDESRNDQLNKYIEKFFPVLTLGKELKVIYSSAIINKCVIIEDRKVFYASTSLFQNIIRN